MKGSVAVIKGLMKFDPKLITTAKSKVRSPYYPVIKCNILTF